LASGSNRVDEDRLGQMLGEKLERMDARAVREVTGFAIGGVAPIGSIAPLATYMDADLMTFPTVWAAAGAPNAVFETEPRALAAAIAAQIISL
jgi:prolyl-tRNA editing enzyme YbaK/EbsC (Cys-tRNA(Pro) deacylase)